MKIYAYKNPLELDKMSIWKDIKTYPHLCVSQTLTEGLKEYYGRDNFGVLCTVDQLLNKVYEEWHNNSEGQVTQTANISLMIDELPDQPLKQTLKHNQADVLKSIRYLIESDIDSDIPTQNLSEEQKLMLEIYRKIENEDVFTSLMRAKSDHLRDYHSYYVDLLRDELTRYIKDKKVKRHLEKIKNQQDHDREMLRVIERVIKSIKEELKGQATKRGIIFRKDQRKEAVEQKIEQASKKLRKIETIKKLFLTYRDEAYLVDYDKVIIHGVHQFTPLILKLVHDLEEAGSEVIFLFNYMSEYSGIYQTWKNVYDWVNKAEDLDVPIIEEGNEYLQRRELGLILSSLYEGDLSKVEESYDVTYTEFDNLTSFSDYVSDVYEKAEEEYKKAFPEDSTTTPENDGKLMKLALMNEQFYAINGTEMNELLKIYFPEQFSSRHFLSYPVGQFIRSLYKMWDNDKEALIIKAEYLKEALALPVWNKDGMPTPLEIFYNINHYFKHEESFEEYLIGLNKIGKIVQNAKKESQAKIKNIGLFIYSPEEMKYFIQVIEDIRVIAEGLFSSNKTKLEEHYKKLMRSVLENESIKKNITDEELELVEEINERLNHITEPMGQVSIREIKDTINYYLEANINYDHEAEWIVRDFEQIDGGILLAAAQQRDQKEKMHEKVFHYAGLSDENMVGKNRTELPWPLDENLFKQVESTTAEICSVCRREYNYFLRYSLFYGTYFLTDNKRISLSYIKKLGDEQAHPYSPFTLMNLKAEEYKYEKTKPDEALWTDYDNNYRVDVIMPTDESEKRCMRACYKRYLFNYCLDKGTYFNDDFYLDFICKFFITYNYMKNHNELVRQGKIGDQFSEQEFSKYAKYFPFLIGMDLEEIKNNIKMELKKPLDKRNTYDDAYVKAKLEFIYKKWEVEDENGQKEDQFKYFMGWQSKEDFKEVFKEFDKFVEDNQKFIKKEGHREKVCEVCNQRYLCMDRNNKIE